MRDDARGRGSGGGNPAVQAQLPGGARPAAAGPAVTLQMFASEQKPTWCPGCGDFAILNAIKQALVELQIAPHQVVLVSGIGCGSKLPDYLHANGFMSLHGRPLPVATGIRLVNPSLRVLVVDGDGDAYGIGGNHFLHVQRRNLDITHIVENNQIYALTKGQYSPTSEAGFRTSTSPQGALEQPVLPTRLAFTAGATFIARGFAGDPKHLASIIAAGIRHPGYALIDVLQPCVTFNKVNTYDWYRERVYEVEETGHDPQDRQAAARLVEEWGPRIPIGVLYEDHSQPTYESQVPGLARGPVVGRRLDDLPDETYARLVDQFR